MNTEVKNNETAKATANTNSAKAADNMRPSIPAKDVKNEPAKAPATAPASDTTAAGGGSSARALAPAAEPSKKELKEQLNGARGLEDTVKLVEQLGKKIAQKNKLSNTITNLDSFLIAQSDDKDDVAGDSKFGRCELVISDDGGEEFVTKNPFIISKVVDMVKSLCLDKLAEVEATIVIPQ